MNYLEDIENLLKDCNMGTRLYAPMLFNSSIFRNNWNKATDITPLAKLFHQTCAFLRPIHPEFNIFLIEWMDNCADHSASYPKLSGIPDINNTCHHPIQRTDPDMFKIYYLPSGINALTIRPSEQDTTSETATIYMATESYNLQKNLAKKLTKTVGTVKIYKRKDQNTSCLYFNKPDPELLSYLHIYAITHSPELFNQKEVYSVLSIFEKLLWENTDELHTHPLVGEIYKSLVKIKEELAKPVSSEEAVNAFTEQWQEYILNNEKSALENKITSYANDAERAIRAYENFKETHNKLVERSKELSLNTVDMVFLNNYFNKFKEIPGVQFHVDNSTLYCMFEMPLAYLDYDLAEKLIDRIPEDITPTVKSIHPTAESVFSNTIINIFKNKSYWKNLLPNKYPEKEFWKALTRSIKKLFTNIFVNRTLAMYLTVCLSWNNTNTNYSPNAKHLDSLPEPFKKDRYLKLWQPHLTYANCWSSARGELTAALLDRNYEDAFLYTVAAVQQITLNDTAGKLAVVYMFGRENDHPSPTFEDAMEKIMAYQKENKTTRTCLKDIITEYLLEELKNTDKETPEKIIKISEDDVEQRNIWLEENHSNVSSENRTITQNFTGTHVTMGRKTYFWIPSGDLLTEKKYEEYRKLFPNAPVSPAKTTIELIQTDTGFWIFPPKQDLPDFLSHLENWAPHWDASEPTRQLFDPLTHTPRYSILTDEVFFIDDEGHYTLATNVTEQFNRRDT